MQDLLAEARKRGIVPEGYEDLFKPPEASTPLSFSDDGGTPAPPPLASPTAPRSASVIPPGGPQTFGEVTPPVETRGFAKDPMADYAKQILSDVGETVKTFPERQEQFMSRKPRMSPELEARVKKFGGIRAPRYLDPDQLTSVGAGIITPGKFTKVSKEVSESLLKAEAESLGLQWGGYMGDLKNGHPVYTFRDPVTLSNGAPAPGETVKDALERLRDRFKPKK